MTPSQLASVLALSLAIYFFGVIFYSRMERNARIFHLCPHHGNDARKGKPLLYRMLTSFYVIKWDFIISQLGFAPRTVNTTTHTLLRIVDAHSQGYKQNDKYLWFLKLLSFALKLIVTLLLWLVTIGNFSPFLSKRQLYKIKI